MIIKRTWALAALVAGATAFATAALAEDPPVSAPVAAPASMPAPAAQPEPAAQPAPAAEPAPATPPAAATTPAAPSGSYATTPPVADGVPAPPAGKGQVVFFRRGGFMGAAIVYKVREGTTAYGTLSPGKYFVLITDPGKHTYVVHSEAKDEMTLDVEEGETYYVEGTVAMGIVVGRANISPSNELAFKAIAKKLKPAHTEPAPTQTAAAGTPAT